MTYSCVARGRFDSWSSSCGESGAAGARRHLENWSPLSTGEQREGSLTHVKQCFTHTGYEVGGLGMHGERYGKKKASTKSMTKAGAPVCCKSKC